MNVTPGEFANALTDLRNKMFDRKELLTNPVRLIGDLEKTVREMIDTAANLPESLRQEVRILLEELRRWLNLEDYAKSYDQTDAKSFARAVQSGLAKTLLVFESRLKSLSLKLAVWLPEALGEIDPLPL